MRSIFAFIVLGMTLAFSPASAQTQNKPAVKTEAAKAGEVKAKRASSPAQEAMRARQKACADEWKTAKANKTAAASTGATTWPKFWSECNKRLKQKQG